MMTHGCRLYDLQFVAYYHGEWEGEEWGWCHIQREFML